MARVDIDIQGMNGLMSAMQNYAGSAEEAIMDVFENEGTRLVEDNIRNILPVSGRTWRGKAPAAKRSEPFCHTMEGLGFIVRSDRTYGYLYFPDDGGTTVHHQGNQRFMIRGAEKAAPDIIDRCLARLTSEI